jgi:hypothetical protein
MHQQRLQAADSRLPLPAPRALSLLTAAAKLRTHLQWTPTSRHLIAQFRALLTVCTNYAFFCRAELGVRCLTHDLVVDRPSKKIWLFIRKAKGDQRRSAADKPILAIPTAANPTLADLLEYYCTQLTAYCKKFYKPPPPPSRTMELRTLRNLQRLASGCDTLRLAPRRMRRRLRHTAEWIQMDIAQPT